MRSAKPTEIKLLIFCGSAENAIMRNTSKEIRKALELTGKTFMILSIPEKVKKQYSQFLINRRKNHYKPLRYGRKL